LRHTPFLFYSYRAHRYLPSFPTRRSSDLALGRHLAHGLGLHDAMAVELAAAQEHLAPTRDIVGRAEDAGMPRDAAQRVGARIVRSEEHTSELQSQSNLVCRLLLEKKKNKK